VDLIHHGKFRNGYFMLKKFWFIAILIFLNPSNVWAEADNLTKLFNEGKYAEFMPQAEALAKENNPEALFLLGKAYHLGKGVSVDIDRAKEFYERAGKLGSARAMNNLGIMIMERNFYARQYIEAITYYEKALAMGLETPTKANLASAYNKLAEFCEQGGCSRAETGRFYVKSGEIYTDFYEKNPTDQNLDPVIHAYVSAYVAVGRAPNQQDLRDLTMKWLNLGISHNLPNAIQNMGAVYYYVDEDVDKAREWFLKGVDHGSSMSAYALATTYSDHSRSKSDEDMANALYKKSMDMGSELGAKKICGQYAQEASDEYYGNVKERFSKFDKALECYMTPFFATKSWAREGINRSLDELIDLTFDIGELEKIQKQVERFQQNCKCEVGNSKLLSKLSTLKLYQANYEARNATILPGNFVITSALDEGEMALVSVPPHSDNGNLAVLAGVMSTENVAGGIPTTIDSETSDKIRAAIKNGDTILVMQGMVGKMAYLKYVPCGNKPCLVDDERQVGIWIWPYANIGNVHDDKFSCHKPELYETGECKLMIPLPCLKCLKKTSPSAKNESKTLPSK
jgi:TPR repeat protein